MSQVAAVTDSCASIPEKILEQLGIHVVAYYIHRGQEVLRDLVDIQRDEFLRWLQVHPACLQQSAPALGVILKWVKKRL